MLRPQKLQADVGMVPTVEFARDSVHQVAMLYSVCDRSMETLVVTEEYDLKPTIKELSLPLSSNDWAYERLFSTDQVNKQVEEKGPAHFYGVLYGLCSLCLVKYSIFRC